MSNSCTQKISYCLVDAEDTDVRRFREEYPGLSVYRRDYDGDLPPIKDVIYVLPKARGKYANVIGRIDVTREVVLGDVHSV